MNETVINAELHAVLLGHRFENTTEHELFSLADGVVQRWMGSWYTADEVRAVLTDITQAQAVVDVENRRRSRLVLDALRGSRLDRFPTTAEVQADLDRVFAPRGTSVTLLTQADKESLLDLLGGFHTDEADELYRKIGALEVRS